MGHVPAKRKEKHPLGKPPFLMNCYIEPRPTEDWPLFWQDGKHIDTFLNGYAIIPKEKYESLVMKANKKP